MAAESRIIYHIAHRQGWEHARQVGHYQVDTLATEGFIHCSTREQVIRTADRFYRGQSDLVLLCIDTGRVEAEIRYEALVGSEEFPHIYDSLQTDAVSRVMAFEPDEDGFFRMPSEKNIESGPGE